MDQQTIDRMRNNLSTADPVACGWAKIVLELLMELEMERVAHEHTQEQREEDARVSTERAKHLMEEVLSVAQGVESERDFLKAEVDNMADTIKRSKKVEAMRQAMIGLIPPHRNPTNRCWCPESRDRDAGHTDNCMRAQVACTKEK